MITLRLAGMTVLLVASSKGGTRISSKLARLGLRSLTRIGRSRMLLTLGLHDGCFYKESWTPGLYGNSSGCRNLKKTASGSG